MAQWRAQLFGAWSLRQGDDDPIVFPTRQCAWILASLMVSPKTTESRESLARKIWPRVPSKKAHASLRNALAAINRVVGDKVFAAEGDLVVLTLDVESDWLRLQHNLHLARTEIDNLDHIERVEQTLGLLFLPGCRLDWVADLRIGMSDLAIEMASLRAEWQERWGTWYDALESAERWRQLAPSSLAATAAVMRARTALGESTRAASSFHQYELKRRSQSVPPELTNFLAQIEAGTGSPTPDMAEVLQDPAKLAEYLSANWGMIMPHAGPKVCLAVAEAAAEAAVPGSAAQAVLLRIAGFSALMAGEPEVAREHLERSVRVADLIGDSTLLAHSSANVALLHTELRNWSAASKMVHRARNNAENSGSPNARAHAALIQGVLEWLHGDEEQAKEILLTAGPSDVRLAGTIQAKLAQFFNHDQNWREASRWAAASLNAAEVSGDASLRARALMSRGLSLAGRGLVDEARNDARQALELASRFEMVQLEPVLLDHVGQTLHMTGDRNLCGRAFKAAESLRQELGNVRVGPEISQFEPLAADCLSSEPSLNPRGECAAIAAFLG